MSDLVWWTIFVILLLLLLTFTGRLCTSVICDVWCDRNIDDVDYDDSELARYQESHAYKQRLSRVSRDTIDYFQHAKGLADENHREPIREAQEPIREGQDRLEPIRNHVGPPQGLAGAQGPITSDVAENEPIGSFAEEREPIGRQQEPNLTEEEVEMRDRIESIRENVRNSAQLIPMLIGTSKDLPFLDMNEKMLRNLIELSQINCADSEELKRRKKEVAEYVRKCQSELKVKATNRQTS